MRKGRFSKEEEEYIESNYREMTPEEIGVFLDRDPESVDLFIKRKYRFGISGEEQAAYELEERPFWAELENQFTKHELLMFKYLWSRIVSQFKDDVVATEELQILDLVKLELLMNRSLKQNKENAEQISEYQRMASEERNRTDGSQESRDLIFNLDKQVASLKASQESLNRDYRELQTKKSALLKEMKATREQRVKRLEESKASFTGWIANLMSNPDVLKKYGLEMEKMRLAMEKEKARLSKYHKYLDGTVDQPMLTPETLKD